MKMPFERGCQSGSDWFGEDDDNFPFWLEHYDKYNYRSRLITQKDYIGKLPKLMNFITERIQTSKYVCESGKEFNQAIINRYLPGEGINPHIDALSIFGPTIYSLTLGSPCVMEFTKKRKRVYVILKDVLYVGCGNGKTSNIC
jgi:alkylated DNA repair dioxygenase AlkB